MTQTTLTLADFLVARIAEDEATARLAAGAPARYGPTPRWVVGESNNDGIRRDDGIPVTRHTWPYEADHITRHDPARVLAECEARRAVVAACILMDGRPENILGSYAYEILCRLAAPYAGHTDYQSEWRP